MANSLTNSTDETIEFEISSVEQAEHTLKRLKNKKKEFLLKKRELSQQQAQIRAEHTNLVRTRGSKLSGFGGFGKFIRAIQTDNRDAQRAKLAQTLAPLEQKMFSVDSDINAIDQVILQIEAYINENNIIKETKEDISNINEVNLQRPAEVVQSIVTVNDDKFNELNFPQAALCYDAGQRKTQPVTFGQLDFYEGKLTGFIVRNDKYGTVFGGSASKIISLILNDKTYNSANASCELYQICRDKVSHCIKWHDFEVYFVESVLSPLPDDFMKLISHIINTLDNSIKLASDEQTTSLQLQDVTHEITSLFDKIENIVEEHEDDDMRDRLRFIVYGINRAAQPFLDEFQDRVDALEDE